MSNERAPENGQRETPSVSRNLTGGLVSLRSNLNAESFPTRLSARHRMPSEHVARKCSACQPAVSSRSDQRQPHRSAGNANKAAVKKTSLLPAKDGSEIKRKRSGLAALISLTRERTSVKVQQDARSKCGTGGKASASMQKTVREAMKRKTTLPQKQPALRPDGARVKTASPQQVWRSKVQPRYLNMHKSSTAKPKGPAQAGLVTTTGKLKKPAVTKLIRGREPEWKSSQGQKIWREKSKAKPTASNSQTNLATNCDSDSDCLASGSDLSSETSDFEHHITWDGFDHRTGQSCSFCEEDLAVMPWGEHDIEFSHLPVVSILSCGHAFHGLCLDASGCAAQVGDPLCVIC